MKSQAEVWQIIKVHMKKEWKTAFLAAFIMGLLIHMPMMLRDIPNHDGLDSMHFDQNMITSGRWFLTVACGISSYFTLPWLIGLLAVVYLALTSAALVEFLEVKKTAAIILISGLLVSFPALASTFAYVFTMDGYMMALLLAVLAVTLTKKYRFGFAAGAVCLACSMGIYQAYLPFAVLLCIYGILMIAMEQGALKEKIAKSLRYLYMGIAGAAGYYIILQILLRMQGKELASYQGINGLETVERTGILDILIKMYTDFIAFTLKGNVLMNNVFSLAAVCGLVLVAAVTLIQWIVCKKWWKSPWLYGLLGLLAVGLPVATNIIFVVSPDVTYHVLMRYQWVLYPILLIGFCTRYGSDDKKDIWKEWCILLTAGVLIWNFALTDNIAYSNLQKKYEKTYAYCVRLLDRIEQTEGYYQGIPIAMIGVVGEESYPVTDISEEVTSGLLGMNGDMLLYTGNNYELFMKHFLGATLNVLPAESMAEMYYSKEYREMESFPAADSIRIIDGIMYIKTENKE
ncbi:MAG: glucosyltransferase domain-containing protein [Anaerotignum sp.]|nr:glucosyltransferase domain-containing protein [Anaerotignum sp.]